MILTENMYVPALRWRQGEYQAVSRLAAAAKDRIAPYITIPEIEFDFEEWRPKKTVQEHVHPFAARFRVKWGERFAWVGVHPSIADNVMDDGRNVFSYVFTALRSFNANCIPAIPLDASPSIISAVQGVVSLDQQGAALSVRLEDLMKPNARMRIEGAGISIGLQPSEIDLVLDLGAPNFEPYAAFSGAMVAALNRLGNLNDFRNLIVLCTAIPETFKDVAKGADTLVRHDWLFYKTLIGRISPHLRRPNFGDYTIVHPNFTPVDMRMIKSAGKLIYTVDGCWEVRKGGAFRDNPEQMYDHCANIVASGLFKGAGYSAGDDYISKCAIRAESYSNQTRWKDVAINHHITHVLDDLAMFVALP